MLVASKKPSINSRLALLIIFFLETCNGTLLDLNAGFNLSVRAALDSYGRVIKAHSAADGHAFFVPFLSSSTFNSTNSSTESLGFAVGFLFLNGSSVTASLAIDRQELEDGIYLAVCAGTSGNHSNLIKGKLPFLNGVNDAEFNVAADAYVVPVWIATKVGRPLKSVSGSLVIVKNELQLQENDSSTVLLTVSNTSMMEMKDSGNLVVWYSKNETNSIFDTDNEPTNTLIQGEKLLVGKQLSSTNMEYSVQMRKGGLVLAANNVQLVAGQPSPYWIFPIHLRNDTYDSNGDVLLNSSIATGLLNDLIASSPCASSNYADDEAFGMLGMASLQFFLEAGSCSKDPSFRGAQRASIAIRGEFPISWSFLKIENDGRLYINAVINNNSTILTGTPATVRYAFDSEESVFTVEGSAYTRSIPIRAAAPFIWGGCDVPMACGPFGVCTPERPARVSCSCPSSDFHMIDPKDSSKGCQLSASSRPACDSYNFSVIEGSSILLFGDWKYASLHLDGCYSDCSSDCSCIGFFASVETDKCLLISDFNISFIDFNISFIDSAKSFRAISFADLSGLNYTTNISTGSYTTHLKMNYLSTSHDYNYIAELVTGISIYIAICVGLVLVGCCSGCCLRVVQRRRRRKRNRLAEEEELRDILPLLPTRFSYKDLQAATNRFGKLLGAGGCGSVYYGVLSDGRKVAVKQLDSLMLISGQSKQLLAEVATVGRTNHLNIVRLLGFCWEDSHRLLVYEFVEKGSLDEWLFIKDSASVDHNELDWPTRYNVALGIARGLSYLHEECEPPVLHFDIKPQNILLDETFVAKVADFGMSRLFQRGLTKVFTDVRGTPGYIAPEWFSHGAVSKKSDVYSMGMVFLEIVGGRKNVDLALLDHSNPLNAAKHEAWHFPSWAAKKCEEGLLMELVDECLHTCGFDAEQAEKLIRTAFWCIQDDPSLRPYAPTVLQWLEGDSSVEKPPFDVISTAAHARISGSFTTSWS